MHMQLISSISYRVTQDACTQYMQDSLQKGKQCSMYDTIRRCIINYLYCAWKSVIIYVPNRVHDIVVIEFSAENV